MEHRFEIEVDHGQFFIEDSSLGQTSDTSNIWEPGKKIASLPGLIGVITARLFGKTRVMLGIQSSELEKVWLKMGECELEVPSGKLLITRPETTDLGAVPKVEVEPGKYTVQVFSKGTETVSDEMAPEGEDEYAVILSKL
jgi:hypothetical protein